MSKVVEQLIAEDIKAIVTREVKRIKAKKRIEPTDIGVLEKLAKVFAILSAAHRDDVRYGLFEKMTTEELEQLAQMTDDLDETEDPA